MFHEQIDYAESNGHISFLIFRGREYLCTNSASHQYGLKAIGKFGDVSVK